MKQAEENKKFRAMSVSDLDKEILALEKKSDSTRLRVTAGKHDDYSMLEKLRKSIARACTIKNEKETEI